MLIASESCFLPSSVRLGSNSVSTFRWPEVRSQRGPSQVPLLSPSTPTGFRPCTVTQVSCSKPLHTKTFPLSSLWRYVWMNRKTSVPESFRRMEMHGASLASSASVWEEERKVDRGLLLSVTGP
ncbi:hypothetical protein TNIN_13231 [Trichonephila inaurata madagascariensis]|uniref:Uncharacterized protein n=1 Tax=Trichonephila inaurata madagascariensis TaxID=2747483 RepID=A0A8X6YT10_9ARAC|nr:hypothetical protein TNIN_13231 [Trichonephila inaurata madagascariensis]